MNKKLNITISKSISHKVVMKAESILAKLKIQPIVFETYRDSIQFEYEKSNGDYLELEIYEDSLNFLLIENGETEELENISEELFIEKLNTFYKIK